MRRIQSVPAFGGVGSIRDARSTTLYPAVRAGVAEFIVEINDEKPIKQPCSLNLRRISQRRTLSRIKKPHVGIGFGDRIFLA